MRSTIVLLLMAALATGGCDKQSTPGSQANESLPAAKAADPANLDRSHKGEAAPDLPFTDALGNKRSIADYAGKPVLVNLWATWCAPCVKEMPMLDALAASKGDALQVLTISQDTDGKSGKALDKVTPFFEKARFKKLQPWLDPEANWSMTMGVNLPTTILYDATGKEVWRFSGDMDWTGAVAAALVAEAG